MKLKRVCSLPARRNVTECDAAKLNFGPWQRERERICAGKFFSASAKCVHKEEKRGRKLVMIGV
jgi:hypothetical protein